MQPGRVPASALSPMACNGRKQPASFRRQGPLRLRDQGGQGHVELQDSDVVCLRSAAADADGYHSLIGLEGPYEMPPLATVTLEKVEEPGEGRCAAGCSGGCSR